MLNPHPATDLAAPAPSRPALAPRADRALISDEEWQALLWPTVLESTEAPTSETFSGELS